MYAYNLCAIIDLEYVSFYFYVSYVQRRFVYSTEICQATKEEDKTRKRQQKLRMHITVYFF